MKLLEAIIAVCKALYQAFEAAFLENWNTLLKRFQRKKKKERFDETNPQAAWTPSPTMIKWFRIVMSFMAVCVISISAYALWRNLTRHPHEDYFPLFIALGQVSGEYARKLNTYRDQVVLVLPEASSARNTPRRIKLEAFRAALLRDGGPNVTTMWHPPADDPTAGHLTSAHLDTVMKSWPNVNTIVSFIGAPHFNPTQLRSWKPGSPNLIVIDSDPDLKQLQTLIASNIVQVAIIPRAIKEAKPLPPTATVKEWFDQHYDAMISPQFTNPPAN